jgi:hypothetical protein
MTPREHVKAVVRDKGAGSFELELSTRRAGTVAFRNCVQEAGVTVCRYEGNASVLRDRQASIRGGLNDLSRRRNEPLDNDIAFAGVMLSELARLSAPYLIDVFDAQHEGEIASLIGRSLGSLDRPGRLDIFSPAGLYLPLAFLPAGSRRYERHSTDRALADTASRMPIFASVVQQWVVPARSEPTAESTTAAASETGPSTPYDAADGRDTGLISVEHEIRRDGTGRVPTTFLWHADSPETKGEFAALAALGGAGGQLDLHGPRPDVADSVHKDEAAADLARLIAGAGGGRPVRIDILHASAHSSVDAANAVATSVISLRRDGLARADPRDDINVTNTLLFEEWRALGGRPLVAGPLAVMSSCESVSSVFLGIRSFVALLLSFGYRAVVGAEGVVRGALAQLFTKYLYEELLKGTPIGLAVQTIRVRMLRSGNPMGFLFGLYGDADLRVAPGAVQATRVTGR